MGVGVGEQAAVGQQNPGDAGELGAPFLTSGEQLEDDERGVVEGDDERLGHVVRGPVRQDEIGAFGGGVGVAVGLVGVAVPQVLHVEPRVGGRAEGRVDLGVAVRAVREAREHADRASGDRVGAGDDVRDASAGRRVVGGAHAAASRGEAVMSTAPEETSYTSPHTRRPGIARPRRTDTSWTTDR